MQVNVAFCRTMQERMFPIGTNLTQGNLVFVPQHRAAEAGGKFHAISLFPGCQVAS